MGGDCGTTDIYAYVKINGEIVQTATMAVTGYGAWNTAEITGLAVSDGDVVTVGIHVACSGAGSGGWGKIDDAKLNSDQ